MKMTAGRKYSAKWHARPGGRGSPRDAAFPGKGCFGLALLDLLAVGSEGSWEHEGHLAWQPSQKL